MNQSSTCARLPQNGPASSAVGRTPEPQPYDHPPGGPWNRARRSAARLGGRTRRKPLRGYQPNLLPGKHFGRVRLERSEGLSCPVRRQNMPDGSLTSGPPPDNVHAYIFWTASHARSPASSVEVPRQIDWGFQTGGETLWSPMTLLACPRLPWLMPDSTRDLMPVRADRPLSGGRCG
jgi:hypothetical protein